MLKLSLKYSTIVMICVLSIYVITMIIDRAIPVSWYHRMYGSSKFIPLLKKNPESKFVRILYTVVSVILDKILYPITHVDILSTFSLVALLPIVFHWTYWKIIKTPNAYSAKLTIRNIDRSYLWKAVRCIGLSDSGGVYLLVVLGSALCAGASMCLPPEFQDIKRLICIICILSACIGIVRVSPVSGDDMDLETVIIHDVIICSLAVAATVSCAYYMEYINYMRV